MECTEYSCKIPLREALNGADAGTNLQAPVQGLDGGFLPESRDEYILVQKKASFACSPEEQSVLRDALLVKRIKNEYDTIGDLLRSSAYQFTKPVKKSKSELCLGLGALVHKIPDAIGRTTAHDSYARDTALLKLLSQMREKSVVLSMYCMDEEKPSQKIPPKKNPVKKTVNREAEQVEVKRALDSLVSLRELVLKRL